MTPQERIAGFDAVPHNQWLSLRLVRCSETGAEVALGVRPDFMQEEGVVHGGILASLADTAAVYAFWPFLADGARMTSIEFKVNFLRPALGDRGDITATSRVVQRGRKLGVCQVDVVQNDVLVAIGTYTYIFF
jgi:uncharacterized protein (TIGR00369 family)